MLATAAKPTTATVGLVPLQLRGAALINEWVDSTASAKKAMASKDKSLLQAVQIASCAGENGCRVVNDGNRGVCVYDCFQWGQHNTGLLLFMRPNAEICIQSSINSLSGFRIIVSEPPDTKFFLRMMLALGTCFLFLFFILFFHGYQYEFCINPLAVFMAA